VGGERLKRVGANEMHNDDSNGDKAGDVTVRGGVSGEGASTVGGGQSGA
jgi:hypothetical protein